MTAILTLSKVVCLSSYHGIGDASFLLSKGNWSFEQDDPKFLKEIDFFRF